MTKKKLAENYRLYRNSDFGRPIEIGNWEKDIEIYGRSPFWRDYARLIHSPSFRRLKSKTQLFPGYDSDFFRCRLTHSIEVGQIGKSIANLLNVQIAKIYKEKGIKPESPFFHFINTDLIEFACYAHDLGHPPFGHQGESELDELMKEYGGFEGNAQTLRIISRIEKKYRQKSKAIENDVKIFKNGESIPRDNGFTLDGTDLREGLSLTYRSLSSILKYDNMIPPNSKERKKVYTEGDTSVKNYFQGNNGEGVIKGFYYTEKDLVDTVKKNVAGDYKGKFKTLECSIMDIADDIAYSIFDLEDAFKAGFTNLFDLYSKDDEILEKVAEKIKKKGEKEGIDEFANCDLDTVREILEKHLNSLSSDMGRKMSFKGLHAVNRISIKMAENGYFRNLWTSNFVSDAIKKITIDTSNECPALWQAKFINNDILLEIEVLKRLTYQFQISSPKLKILEYRGRSIVRDIFNVLTNQNNDTSYAGWEFLPEDYATIYEIAEKNKDTALKMRTVCDFIAGMTDSYALEYRNKLFASNLASIHKRI